MNSIQEAGRLGHGIWLDYVQRGMFRSGEFRKYLDLGITGVTSNPTIFEKAINESHDYDDDLLRFARAGRTTGEIYEALVLEDIGAAADMLRPIYDSSKGEQGFVSLEVSPLLAFDTDKTVADAKRLFALLHRPNILIKVPATAEGIAAVRTLISEGVNVNATLIFSLSYYKKVMESYLSGLEMRARNGGDLSNVASVASFFVSRIDTAVDALLEEKIRSGQVQLKSLLGKAAVANAQLSYQEYRKIFQGERFAALLKKKARVQRPVWASTGTKNPAYSDVLYVEPLIGPETVNTLPPGTIKAFLEHGQCKANLCDTMPAAGETMKALAKAGIDMDAVTTKLLDDGVKSFSLSFEKLLKGIDNKKKQLLA